MVESFEADEVGFGVISLLILLGKMPKDEFSGKKYIHLQIVR